MNAQRVSGRNYAFPTAVRQRRPPRPPPTDNPARQRPGQAEETVMSFFDSPIGRCPVVREMVLLDETQAECAREHECPPGQVCPLEDCFTRVSGRAPDGAEIPAAAPAAHEARKAAL